MNTDVIVSTVHVITRPSRTFEVLQSDWTAIFSLQQNIGWHLTFHFSRRSGYTRLVQIMAGTSTIDSSVYHMVTFSASVRGICSRQDSTFCRVVSCPGYILNATMYRETGARRAYILTQNAQFTIVERGLKSKGELSPRTRL